MTKVRKSHDQSNNVEYIEQQIRELEERFQQHVNELREELEQAKGITLISPDRAAEILNISVSAVRRRADRGDLTKYNADGSRKVTNRRTPIYFDEKEVRDRI